jgi:hypothetical protein
LLWGVFFAAWTCGCAHSHHPSAYDQGGAADYLPRLTALTTGPLASLWPAAGVFGADFTLTLEHAVGPPTKLSGRLFALNGRLRLEAVSDQSHGRHSEAYVVIWNGVTHRGWLVSEALQGYAPVTESLQFTNRLTRVQSGPGARMEDHPVDLASVTLLGANGQNVTLKVTAARDLGGLPLRLEGLNGPGSFTLALSHLQPVRPAVEGFLAPDGYTRFASAAVLVDELAARQQNVFGGGSLNQTGNRGRAGENPDSP